MLLGDVQQMVHVLKQGQQNNHISLSLAPQGKNMIKN